MSEKRTCLTAYCTEHTAGGMTVVELHGEVDILAALSLSAHLDALTAGPRPDVVLDLRPVSFLDCAGLGLLCRARNRVLQRQGHLRLITNSDNFLRLLRHTGLRGVFELHPEVPMAPQRP